MIDDIKSVYKELCRSVDQHFHIIYMRHLLCMTLQLLGTFIYLTCGKKGYSTNKHDTTYKKSCTCI